jgi:hypothetical protein
MPYRHGIIILCKVAVTLVSDSLAISSDIRSSEHAHPKAAIDSRFCASLYSLRI